MIFSLEQLSQLFNQNIKDKRHIDQIVTDSREKSSNSLFVPIVGEKFNAHHFLMSAIENGAIASLWEKNYPLPAELEDNFPIVYVDDTLEALQTLAHAYRKKVNPTVIGITGSNGKTTTKDIMYSIVRKQFKAYCTQGNFNNLIGLPLTILQMPEETEVLVLEMGMSEFGEIEQLSKIAEPDYGIITNIGESHIEFLGSREGIAEAKLEITTKLHKDGLLFVDGDEAILREASEEMTYVGFAKDNDIVISDVFVKPTETSFNIHNTGFHLPLIGKHHAKNAALAIQVAHELNMTDDMIQAGLLDLAQTGMRFELIKGKNDVTLINDAYNASATSMQASIDVLKQLDGFERKIVVLADILELGQFSETYHRQVAHAFDQSIDYIFTVGHDARFISDQASKNGMETKHFTSKDDLTEHLQSFLDEKTIILFKGSRGMALETIVHALV